MTNLALKYRPQRFSDLAGQPGVSVVLGAMVAKNEVPSVLLFHGTRGSGKTSAARILAAALNCTGADTGDADGEVPCGWCEHCTAIRGGGSVDVIEVDAASNGTADAMRAICNQVRYSIGGLCRVVVLDEAHGLSRPAFDVLLKTLEETPPGVVFILASTEPAKIPATIASRCVSFSFRRIGPRQITERLVMIRDAEGLTASDALIAEIAERADGGMRDAVMLLDQCARAAISDVAGFEEMTGITDFGPGLVRAMLAGDYGRLFQLTDQLMNDAGDPALITARCVRCLRDVLVLKADGPLACSGAALAARRELAAALTPERCVAALRVMWDMQKVRALDARAALDLAVVMCAEQLRPASGHWSNGPVPVQSNGHRKATMADIAAMGGGSPGG